MISIRLKGGMGNQMFQYAFIKSMAQRLDSSYQLDLTSLMDRSKRIDGFVFRNFDLSLFNIHENYAIHPYILKIAFAVPSASITRYFRKKAQDDLGHFVEKEFHFQPELIETPKDNMLYEGWFQSYKYFNNIASAIRKDFAFKNEIMDESTALLGKINKSKSVCLNVRRTDFLQVDNLNVTNLNYFYRSMEIIESKIANPEYFVFSDDIEWCKENLRSNYPVQFVDHQHKGLKFGNYLQLMKHCKHFIIPNSSFAFWGAWLSAHKNKIVIAPKRWFADPAIDTSHVTPPSWLRI